MEIRNKDDILLALFIFKKDITSGKNFFTDNKNEFQVASFSLNKGDEILRHYHPSQNRLIEFTSEVLVLFEGKIKVDIYDLDKKHIFSEIINSGDTVALFNGGHSLEILESSQFVEVKQGPYNEETGKERF